MALPSVAELLRLPELRSGRPVVVAGAASLGNPVRWVHSSDLPDIARLLDGGELLLTTGVGLQLSSKALKAYALSLADAGVAGLVIEAGRTLDRVPDPLARVANERGLPIVLLDREVRFVQVTQEAHALIIESHAGELRMRDEIHDAFTQMAVEGSSVSDVLRYTASVVQRPVLFVDRGDHIVAFEPSGVPPSDVLASWHRSGRTVPTSGGSQFVVADHGWLLCPVAARGETWGRLALMESEVPSSNHVRIILERAAVGLVLNRLVERDRDTLELQAHRSLVRDLVSGTVSPAALQARAEALGFETEHRVLVAGYVKVSGSSPDHAGVVQEKALRDLSRLVSRSSGEAGVHTLVGPLPTAMVGMLASFGSGEDANRGIANLADRINQVVAAHGHPPVMIAFGSKATSLRETRWSFQEAEQVVAAVPQLSPKSHYQIADVRLQGLLYLLRGDQRLQTFCERELSPLVRFDARHGTKLLLTLRAFVTSGGNKASAAATLNLSRPTFYGRLAHIERILQVDLSSTESRLSLHVALLAREASETATPA